ncbi:MAG: amidohydrolase family protein [Pseudomonadota bacterium]
MNVQVPNADRETGGQAGLKVIDCDVHPMVAGGLASLLHLMPNAWAERFKLKSATATSLGFRFEHPAGSAARHDAKTPSGGPAGSDPDYMRKDLLDQHNISLALLTSLQAGQFSAIASGPDESAVIVSAFNDHFLDVWPLKDEKRLRLAMTVPVQDPQAAVAEIKRVGSRGEVAAIYLPLINILLGNRYYWPIYEAAVEHDLPILLHVTGTDSVYQGAPNQAGGFPENYPERYVALSQIGEANLTSLCYSSVFERFPTLKFMFVEYSFAWALPLLWRINRTWESLRYDVPWVKRPPREYVSERVRFSTQPLDEPDNPAHLKALIDMLGPEHLVFSTDYPHWDNDMPGQSLLMLEPEVRRQILSENAEQVLRI